MTGESVIFLLSAIFNNFYQLSSKFRSNYAIQNRHLYYDSKTVRNEICCISIGSSISVTELYKDAGPVKIMNVIERRSKVVVPLVADLFRAWLVDSRVFPVFRVNMKNLKAMARFRSIIIVNGPKV